MGGSSEAMLRPRTGMCTNPTHSCEQKSPEAEQKFGPGSDTFTHAYLFLVQPKLLTMTLLVHYSTGKDNSVMQIHVVSALGRI